MRLPDKLKRKVAEWAFQHLEPELGEWRKVRGTHWRLVSINTHLDMGAAASSMELHYVQPIAFMPVVKPEEIAPLIWDSNVPASELLPGDWRAG
jgi:hypothetical protein